ncbi:hypothetical protein CRUP_015109 [Coryphaenoides rupestris]|nr:hypothetical protein CRUP_015109 [Coryphaenoides rupestris]
MQFAAVAFYGAALALLATGLRELLLTGFEENKCSMTYMFEYPEYRRVSLPRRVSRLYPAYGLYLYGEGLYAQETRALKLTGAPVLFLPGNAGSYKQARSLGSVALRKAENMEGGLHLNVFTVDFNEELVALYGGSLRRQTLFLHECIKAVLRLYKGLDRPPSTVVLVGHSMGGVVARALFTLPRFSPNLVSLIITQASPHLAPVLALDTHLLEFYSAVRERWVRHADNLANITVLSVGGGYRDYQVRSGLASLPCSPGDPNKLSLVATAVPRTWVSTDHLSIVWCKELVLATVRALFDLIDHETRQLTDSVERRMQVLDHHFIRHPVRMLDETQEPALTLPDFPEAWTEVNALRLAYSTPKEGQAKYFLFALSSRRKAYSHFYCRSNNMVLILSLSDLSSVSHLVVGASNLNGKQFTVECEWQRQESQTVSVAVPHVLSFGADKDVFPQGFGTVLEEFFGTAVLCPNQVLRFCGPLVPVYTAVTLLLACGVQLWSIARTGKPLEASRAVGRGLQPHKVGLPVYLLHLLLGCEWFQEAWSVLGLPAVDGLPPTVPDRLSLGGASAAAVDEWPRLLWPLLYVLGAGVAFWGSALLRAALRLLSLVMAPLHRPSVSPDCGTLGRRTQVLLILALSIVGGTSCGAVSIFTAFLLHLYRVLRLQMAERSLSHMLNLAPEKQDGHERNGVSAGGPPGAGNGGGPLLTEGLLYEVRHDLQLHYSLSVLFTLPIMLGAPSLIHWTRNLSKLLRLVCHLPLPLCVAMVTFSPLHLYRVTYFLSAALVPLAVSRLL